MIQQSHSWAYIQTKLIRKDSCTPKFIAALFTIAKTRKQPKCPSREEWIKKKWYIYTMEYDSAMKKNEIMPFGAICPCSLFIPSSLYLLITYPYLAPPLPTGNHYFVLCICEPASVLLYSIHYFVVFFRFHI